MRFLRNIVLWGTVGLGILASSEKDNLARYFNSFTSMAMNSPADRASLERYESRRRAQIKEYEDSETVSKKILPPEDAPTLYKGAPVFAIDLNGDGQEELFLSECGHGISCTDALFTRTGPQYTKILDRYAYKASNTRTSGWRDIFVREFRPIASERYAIVTTKVKWNGSRYVKDHDFMLPEDAQVAASILQRFSQTEQRPEVKRRVLMDLKEAIGPYDALYVLLAAQNPLDYRIPPGKFPDFALAYAKEAHLSAAASLTHEQFEDMLYSHLLDDRFLNPTSKTFLPFVLMRSVDQTFDVNFRREVEIMRKAEDHSGDLDDAIRKMGRLPTHEEYGRIIRMGAAGTAREEQLRDTPRPNDSITARSYDPLTRTEIETQRIYPNMTQGQIGSMAIQEGVQQRQQEIQQNFNQGAERGRQMINQMQNLFQPKDPKQQ